MKRFCVTLALAVAALGCGDDDSFLTPPVNTATVTATSTSTGTATPTPTTTPTATRTATAVPTATATAAVVMTGPQITFFGITRADEVLIEPSATADDGTHIYTRTAGVSGNASGFVLVIEGKPGPSGDPVGISTYDPTGLSFPDLAIQVTQALGNGSTAVCDDPRVNPGGVPATSPVSFDATPENIAAANDFGCRFLDGAGGHKARASRSDSCVSFNGEFDFVEPQTQRQFCGFVNVPMGFPPGDTTVTARLRDVRGNWGELAQIIIRVPAAGP